MDASLPVAVFLSGSGRTLANLIDHQKNHGLNIDIRLAIASRDGLKGQLVAEQAKIPTLVIRQTDHNSPQEYCQAMFDPVRACGATHVLMAGFLKLVLIPDDFAGRVLNIHPSLLPAFGGAGMYGQRVHQAAIDRGVKVSGCTVHFVDNQYDHGPILHQKVCSVFPQDTPETLAARVFELECEAFPEALRMLT